MPDDQALARRPADLLPAVRRAVIPAPLTMEDARGLDPTELSLRGTALVRAYLQIEDAETAILRSVAVVLVALRAHYTDREGRPDMRGSSYAYRQAAGEIYSMTGIGADTSGMQQAVRWHVGSILREELSSDQLESYGLKPSTPLDRGRDRRALTAALVRSQRAEVVGAVMGEDSEQTTRAVGDHVRLAAGVVNILHTMRPDTIADDMTPGQRRRLDVLLNEASERIALLRSLIAESGI
jgi:hypothetical protein